MIFDITDCAEEFVKFIKEDYTINNIDVHIRMFDYHILKYKCNGYNFIHDYREYSNGKKQFLRKNHEFMYQIIDELCAETPISYEPIVKIGGEPIVVENRIEIIK